MSRSRRAADSRVAFPAMANLPNREVEYEKVIAGARLMGHVGRRTAGQLPGGYVWRGEKDGREHADVPSFYKAAKVKEIQKHEYVLTLGRYVWAEAAEEDDEPFDQKMKRLVAQLREQQAEAAKLDAAIAANLRELGYGD